VSSIHEAILAVVLGIALGFFGSMPIAGPTAVILVSKGLDNHRRSGIFIAAGAATAESVYVFMAFWGLTSALTRFPMLLPITRLVGAVLLTGLGLHFVLRRTKPRDPLSRPPEQAGHRSFLFGLSLTALNPSLLVTWTAAVSVAHSTGLLPVETSAAGPFALGAALGIVGWFAILLWLLSRFGDRVSGKTLDRVMRWMGGVLILVGLELFLRGILKLHDS
jgi:threonine/homoserine/homoserine lactone efflux protein